MCRQAFEDQRSRRRSYPRTQNQRCIEHVVRNTLRYVEEKDKKAFANDYKAIYHATSEEEDHARMEAVSEI